MPTSPYLFVAPQARVYKKVAFEKLPPLKTRALAQPGSDEVHDISISREFFLVNDAGSNGVEAVAQAAADAGGEPIPPEDLRRAYRCESEISHHALPR